MKEPTYVITYDVGTTGVKTCLFEIGEVVRLTAAAMRGYELYVLPDGGAEQEPPNGGKLCARARGRCWTLPAWTRRGSVAFPSAPRCRESSLWIRTGSRCAAR